MGNVLINRVRNFAEKAKTKCRLPAECEQSDYEAALGLAFQVVSLINACDNWGGSYDEISGVLEDLPDFLNDAELAEEAEFLGTVFWELSNAQAA